MCSIRFGGFIAVHFFDRLAGFDIVNMVQSISIAGALMEPGMAYELQTVRSEAHRKRVEAFVQRTRKKP